METGKWKEVTKVNPATLVDGLFYYHHISAFQHTLGFKENY